MSRQDTDKYRDHGVVLVIEHDAAVADLTRRYLERDGLSVRLAGTLAKAVTALAAAPPAVVVLDLTMPGLTRGGVRRRLPVRGQSGVPQLICLEGPGGLRPRHVGITRDGDWRCLRRPFSARLLTTRVQAAMRQAAAGAPRTADASGTADGPGTASKPGTAGALVLDAATRRASSGAEGARLTATEFSLLAFLTGNPGRVFTRQQLLDAVWAGRGVVTAKTVDVHVACVRAKLGAHCPIRTVRGVGYAAVAPSGQPRPENQSPAPVASGRMATDRRGPQSA